jgi:hypothetical protein
MSRRDNRCQAYFQNNRNDSRCSHLNPVIRIEADDLLWSLRLNDELADKGFPEGLDVSAKHQLGTSELNS